MQEQESDEGTFIIDEEPIDSDEESIDSDKEQFIIDKPFDSVEETPHENKKEQELKELEW